MARLEVGVDITVEGARELDKAADAINGTSDELDDLAKLLDNAADSARKAADDLDDVSGSLRFEGANRGAQSLEDAGEGVRNAVNGIGDAFRAASDDSLTFGERLALGAGGVADMANGVRNALLPVLSSLSVANLKAMATSVLAFGAQIAGWIATAAAAVVNAAIIAAAWVVALGPVGLLVAAIIAAVALIILNWDKVTAFIADAVDFMVKLFEGFARFFTEVWDGMMDFLKGIGRAIVGFGKKLWEPIGKGFEAAVDFIKGIWNAFVRFWNSIEISIPSVDIPLVGRVGGFTIGLPDLPQLATGGIVTQPTLALIGERGPEAVVPLNRANGFGGTTVNLTVNGDVKGDERRLPGQMLRALYVSGLSD